MVEDFGIEEFGVDETPAEEPAESKEELQALIDELVQQLAGTIDDLTRQKLKNAKHAAILKLAGLHGVTNPTFHKVELQWLQLRQACREFHGNDEWYQRRLGEYGGLQCDEAYDDITKVLSELNKAHEQAKATKPAAAKRNAGKKDAAPETPTISERFAACLAHATNLGIDGQVLWDELGWNEVDDAKVTAFLEAINERAGNQLTVEEFGAGEDSAATDEPAAASAESTAVTSTNSECADASTQTPTELKPWLVSVEGVQGVVDPETGAVMDLPFFLEAIGLTEMPQKEDKEICAKILDVMNTFYLHPAKRYRENADRLAAPKELRGKQMEAFFGPYLDACGAKYLPQFDSDSKPSVKAPHKKGDFKSKTLQLLTAAISWTKSGGTSCTDEGKFHIWLAEKETEYRAAIELGDDELAEQLANTYGFKLVSSMTYDRKKIEALPVKELPPGWEHQETNHFAKRTIK